MESDLEDSVELIAFDDEDGDYYEDGDYQEYEDVDTEVVLPSTLVDINILNAIVPYMDVRTIRSFARTSSEIWPVMKKVWNGNAMWRVKTERLLDVLIPADITYHDWEYIYLIAADDNLPMLYELKSPSMVRLGLLLGVNMSSVGRRLLGRALADKDIPMISALLVDRTLDPENSLLRSYIDDYKDTAYAEQLSDILVGRL